MTGLKPSLEYLGEGHVRHTIHRKVVFTDASNFSLFYDVINVIRLPCLGDESCHSLPRPLFLSPFDHKVGIPNSGSAFEVDVCRWLGDFVCFDLPILVVKVEGKRSELSHSSITWRVVVESERLRWSPRVEPPLKLVKFVPNKRFLYFCLSYVPYHCIYRVRFSSNK